MPPTNGTGTIVAIKPQTQTQTHTCPLRCSNATASPSNLIASAALRMIAVPPPEFCRPGVSALSKKPRAKTPASRERTLPNNSNNNIHHHPRQTVSGWFCLVPAALSCGYFIALCFLSSFTTTAVIPFLLSSVSAASRILSATALPAGRHIHSRNAVTKQTASWVIHFAGHQTPCRTSRNMHRRTGPSSRIG